MINLSSNNKKYVDFYCGLISGLVSNTICNPFDVIRTNKQLNNKISYNFTFLSRGILSGFITIPTFWSIYFESYNNLKQINQSKFNFLNGYIASNIASTITCPLWFIRQKNHVNQNFNVFSFYKSNGILPFYNALFSTYIINASFIIQMPLYENLKKNEIIKNKISNDSLRIFLITSISKTVATCFFYPFDTIRTIKRNNHSECIIKIINKLNINPIKYYSGLNIYLMRSIPYHTITFCTFEYFKNSFKKK
jgi:hypothetical protein